MAREIRAEMEGLSIMAIGGKAQRQRPAGIPMPGFGGIHAVPMAEFIGSEQKIDRRARTTPARFRRIPPDFTVMPAFRVGCQAKGGNDLRGGYAGAAQVNHGSADRDGFGERRQL